MSRFYSVLLLAAGFLLFIPPSGGMAAFGKKDVPPGEEKQTMTTEKTDRPLAGIAASGGDAEAEILPGEMARLRGRIRLVGNMPFPRLVITDESDRDWYLEGADRDLLAPYEQQTLTLTGRAEYQDIILANGTKAGSRRFLRDVRVVENP
jgi:hypothetical protein